MGGHCLPVKQKSDALLESLFSVTAFKSINESGSVLIYHIADILIQKEYPNTIKVRCHEGKRVDVNEKQQNH